MSGRSGPTDPRQTSGSLLAHNAYINLVGQAAPILVAIFAIPLLIKDMGTERFGVLALAWVVMGYFGLFDFGLGRATTKFVAEYHARDRSEDLPELVWSSVIVHVCLGFLGGSLLAALSPWLTGSVLNIPSFLLGETKTSFYLLAVSIPLVVTTAALRGVLEAVQRFDMVNIVKIPASILNYAGPLPVLLFTDSLVAVVGFLVISRGIALLAYLFLCLRALPVLSHGFRFNAAQMKPLFGFGGWLTASSFIGPSIASIDRFVIGTLISLTAVTFYTTSYEAITKLTMFSSSLLAVLFPAFSAMTVNRSQEIRQLYLRASKYLLVLVAPIVGVLLALATELLTLWVSAEFAVDSAPVAKWLAVGILLVVLAQAPITVLQSMGRADVPSKLQVAQLPFYAFAVWYLCGWMGIIGVAVAWTLRALIDAVMLFIAADRLLPPSEGKAEEHFFWTGSTIVSCFLLLSLGIGWLPVGLVVVKLTGIAVLTVLFTLWEWMFFLSVADRKAFAGGAKSLIGILSR